MAGDMLLEQRYGRRSAPTHGRRFWVVVVGLITIGVAWAAWIAVQDAQTPVSWEEDQFIPVDPGHSQLRFTVTIDAGRKAVCSVQIFNTGLTEVGRIDVPVGPSSQPSFSVTATVPTFELGHSGDVRTCAVH